MTLIELVLAMAVIAILTLAVATMFKLAIISSTLSTAETTLLSNARKALNGDGPARGFIFDSFYASSATALSGATLSVYNPGNTTVSYALSSTNLLRTSGATTKTLATGLSNLAFAYYNLDGNGRVAVSTVAASVQLVTYSFELSLPKRTVYFFSAGGMRNRP